MPYSFVDFIRPVRPCDASGGTKGRGGELPEDRTKYVVFNDDLADALIHSGSEQNTKHDIIKTLHEPETVVKHM